jgi:hypothetical protein
VEAPYVKINFPDNKISIFHDPHPLDNSVFTNENKTNNRRKKKKKKISCWDLNMGELGKT